MRLRIRDRQTYSGDFKAIIHAPANPGFDTYAQIRNGASACGALVEFVRSDKNLLFVDKFLRITLKASEGDFVDVEDCQPEVAKSVVLQSRRPWEIDEREVAGIRALLADKPVCEGQLFPKFNEMGNKMELTVGKTRPTGIVTVEDGTKIVFEEFEPEQRPREGVTWQDVRGLDREVARIRKLIEWPLRQPQAHRYFGVEPPRGVLLYGPPGTGKTLIAKALQNEVGAEMYILQGADVMAPHFGESERRLRETFERARENAPAIILIDEVDALTPSRDSRRGEVSLGLVTTMCSLLDGLKDMTGVIVVGTTNRVNEIDQALRRPGRFEYEIMIGPPDRLGRRDILDRHVEKMPLAPDVDRDKIADNTSGYTGADVASLCREAGRCALWRYFSDEDLEMGHVSPEGTMQVTYSDFLAAMKNVQPSVLRGGLTVEVVKDVTFEDIGGLDEAKEMLAENLVLGGFGDSARALRPAKGILLYGPSGTGKTMLARAAANHCQANLITLRGPETHRKWFGESEEIVRSTFAKAREVAPCIILLDEVDALAPYRGSDASRAADSVTSQVISEMEKINAAEQVFVIATTNQPENIDPALRRPGRIDVEINIPKPKEAGDREAIFRIHLKDVNLADNVDLEELARQANKFSGADIAECCRRALFQAWKDGGYQRENMKVTMEHLQQAARKVRQTNRFKSGESGLLGF